MNPSPRKVTLEQIHEAHQLYCQMTGQNLSLRYNRERLWWDLLRCGYDLKDLSRLIRYLQQEIRESRRNVGALKLSNLLQPDRFEEDLALSRVQLYAPKPKQPSRPKSENLTPEQLESQQRQTNERFRKLRQQLDLSEPQHRSSKFHNPSTSPNENNSTK